VSETGTTRPSDIERLQSRLERERRARQEAESIAERMVARLHLTLDSLEEAQTIAHVGSWQWDIAPNRVAWSDEMYRIWGLEPEDFAADYEGYLSSIHPDDRPHADAAVRQAMQDHRPFSFEHRVVRGDGSEVMVAGKGRVECDGNGNPIRMRGTAQDITELKEAETLRLESHQRVQQLAQLQEANRFKTLFINTAAHELLTPLTPLRTLVHVMSRDSIVQREPKFSRYVEILSRNLERLTKLVQDLLDASRMEGGKIGIKRDPVRLSDVCQTALESFHPEAEAKGVHLESKLSPDVVVNGDADRLVQVVTNLISNALKFTPSGGKISVHTRRDADRAVLTVTDTGVGIEPDFMSRLFQPFSRAHLVSDQMQPGTGLGLFVTKGFVDLHGGNISCQSPGKGRGTTFTVSLPL